MRRRVLVVEFAKSRLEIELMTILAWIIMSAFVFVLLKGCALIGRMQ